MGRKWTDEQNDAINAQGGSLLVSAAAGSGKTAVLIERVVKRITSPENPVDVDRLMIVTYTRLAASELKQRLTKALRDILSKDPKNKYILRQLSLLNRAAISTVDSFCSSVVREFFYKIDIQSDFRIADDTELKLIKNDALELTLESFYEKKSPAFYNLVETFSSQKNDNNLEANILKLYEFLCSHPFGADWLNEKKEYYKSINDVKKTVWGKIMINRALDAVKYCAEIAALSKRIFTECDELHSTAVGNIVADDENGINAVLNKLENGSWDEICDSINSYSQMRFSAPRALTAHPDKLRIQENRKAIKGIIDNLKKSFSRYEKDCIDDIDALRPTVQAFFECVEEFSKNYSYLKAEKHVADYSDLEHWTLDILCKREDGKVLPSDTALLLQSRFDEIIVDEYQDANEVQELIFKMLSKNESNIFAVGDVKQSIYGFRQAQPQIFLRRRESYKHYDREKDMYPAKIILKKNFRSRDGITDGVNFVFKLLMSDKLGDMYYTQDEYLVAGASYPERTENDVELALFDLDRFDNTDSCVVEATYIANRIHQMVSQGFEVTQNGVTRPVTYGDFAVLLRSTQGYSKTYIDVLASMGIPANAKSKETFLESREISLLVNLLRVIDNPMRDIPLLSVLMSVIFAFSPDDIAKLRENDRKEALYISVKKSAENGSQKCIDFLNILDKFRSAAATLPTHELIISICEDLGYTSLMGVVCKSPKAADNIHLFIEYAKSYEANSYRGLGAFIGLIDKIADNGSDLVSQTASNATENSVSIMSVHSSKGLEFPVCFLANTSHKFNEQSLNENVLLHSNLGIAMKRRDAKRRVQFDTLPRQALRIQKMNSERSEELRVLYVALTRAKEKLIMLFSKEKLENYLSSLSGKLASQREIPQYVAANANSIGDLLVMTALMHKSGAYLRQKAGRDILSYVGSEKDWDINIIASVSDEPCVGMSASGDESPKNVNEAFFDFFDERFGKKYEYAQLQRIPVKISVSQLAHSKNGFFDETQNEPQTQFDKTLKKPSFLSEKKLTSAQKGTAVHTFLQMCDFSLARKDITSEINRITQNGFLSGEQANSIDKKMLSDFLNSSLIDEVTESNNVLREFNFNVQIEAGKLDNSIAPPFDKQKIILQGCVDLAYEKNGKMVVVDYKTDRIKNISVLAQRYKEQVEMYGYAVFECTEMQVDKCILYSLYLNEYIEL